MTTHYALTRGGSVLARFDRCEINWERATVELLVLILGELERDRNGRRRIPRRAPGEDGRRKLSANQRKEILRRWVKGESARELCREYGVSSNYVHKTARELGVVRKGGVR